MFIFIPKLDYQTATHVLELHCTTKKSLQLPRHIISCQNKTRFSCLPPSSCICPKKWYWGVTLCTFSDEYTWQSPCIIMHPHAMIVVSDAVVKLLSVRVSPSISLSGFVCAMVCLPGNSPMPNLQSVWRIFDWNSMEKTKNHMISGDHYILRLHCLDPTYRMHSKYIWAIACRSNKMWIYTILELA